VEKEILTIIVPCYNKEKYVGDTISQIKELCKIVEYYQINAIFVDDASTDKTRDIIEMNIVGFKNFSYISHEINRGLGGTLKSTLDLVLTGKFTIISGDNDLTLESLLELCRVSKFYDVTLGYFTNAKVRGIFRKSISAIYTKVLNLIMSTDLRYINSPGIYDRQSLSFIKINSNGFSCIFELNYLAKKFCPSLIQIPITMNSPKEKHSSTLRVKTILDTLKSINYLKKYVVS
jgi:glycosyltransferase involved in cell wall biosynthesis